VFALSHNFLSLLRVDSQLYICTLRNAFDKFGVVFDRQVWDDLWPHSQAFILWNDVWSLSAIFPRALEWCMISFSSFYWVQLSILVLWDDVWSHSRAFIGFSYRFSCFGMMYDLILELLLGLAIDSRALEWFFLNANLLRGRRTSKSVSHMHINENTANAMWVAQTTNYCSSTAVEVVG